MDRTDHHRPVADYLYPPIEPFDQRHLDVDHGHRIYVEQSGNPDGQPIVLIHGGPGGGTSPAMRRFFDPKAYRIILFDQRGCGHSQPRGSVEANTTWDLLADMERIRSTLGIDRWILFGGSWGATLALTYAITHPQRVQALVLRGVFLGTQSELDWFYGGGAARFFPQEWDRLCAPIPPEDRHNLIAAYHARLFGPDIAEQTRFGRLWTQWENSLAALRSEGHDAPPGYARVFAQLESHYFHNACFLPEDGWILRNRHRIEHLPAIIVQGRYDMICPPAQAMALAQGWERARLQMIPAAGHAMSEPGIAAALVRATDALRP